MILCVIYYGLSSIMIGWRSVKQILAQVKIIKPTSSKLFYTNDFIERILFFFFFLLIYLKRRVCFGPVCECWLNWSRGAEVGEKRERGNKYKTIELYTQISSFDSKKVRSLQFVLFPNNHSVTLRYTALLSAKKQLFIGKNKSFFPWDPYSPLNSFVPRCARDKSSSSCCMDPAGKMTLFLPVKNSHFSPPEIGRGRS